MQIKNGTEYHSLYEYLGYAAGKELGGKVRKAARKAKQPTVTQHVEQGGYEGEVLCYTTEFLDEYFHAVENKESYTKYPDYNPEEEDLPF